MRDFFLPIPFELSRCWWRMLLLWLLICIPGVYLVYHPPLMPGWDLLASFAILLISSGLVFSLFLVMRRRYVRSLEKLTRIFGVEAYPIPPLPSHRTQTRAPGTVAQFHGATDHVRFAYCERPPASGRALCVMVTSAEPSEGKTTLAAQLAVRCCLTRTATLLIDFDLRKPALAKLLEVGPGDGVVQILNGEAASPKELAQSVNPGFHLLPAGKCDQGSHLTIYEKSVAALLAAFRDSYDLILIDTPPLSVGPDALAIAKLMDVCVVATRYGHSQYPSVERAKRLLEAAGVTSFGVVSNAFPIREPIYDYGADRD